MSGRLLTLQEVADRLGLSQTPRAVYSLPIARSPLSARRTRWAEDDVEAYRLTQPATFAPRCELPSIAEILATPTIAPTQPGVYFLLRRGKIVYVGQSKNPLFRIGQHATRLKFDAFAVLPCAMEDLLVFEGAFILKFRPRYNKNGL